MARLSALQAAFEKNPLTYSVLLIFAAILLFYSNSFTADWHYDDFHQCETCDQVYWQGSHFMRLQAVVDGVASETPRSRK